MVLSVGGAWDLRAIPPGPLARDASRMADRIVAETLPELYRSILDAVADLEAGGHRREALRVRARAATVYGRAWDAKATSTLEHLRQRAVRVVEHGARADEVRPPTRGTLRMLLARATGHPAA